MFVRLGHKFLSLSNHVLAGDSQLEFFAVPRKFCCSRMLLRLVQNLYASCGSNNYSVPSISMNNSVRIGGIFYALAPIQFVVCMFITALYYGPASYNPLSDTISDLQAVKCGLFQGNPVCSPLHLLANSSVVALGLMIVAGTFLIRPIFPLTLKRTIALSLLIAGGLGAVANGFAPEDVSFAGDVFTALIAFLGANFGLVQIGGLMSNIPSLSGLRIPTRILGSMGLGALIADGVNIVPQYPGLVEKTIVAPVLVWSFVVGIRILTTTRSLRSRGVSSETQKERDFDASIRACHNLTSRNRSG